VVPAPADLASPPSSAHKELWYPHEATCEGGACGTAYAANTIGSSDVIDESLLSQDIKNNELGSADVKNNADQSPDVRAESLTGADIADQSGVDTCVSTIRLGQLCVRAENADRTWTQALNHCANLDLRLPSLTEA
jgi:hypothetical protein